jgi:hypothetical protein
MQNREGRIKNIKKIIIAAGILSEHTCFNWKCSGFKNFDLLASTFQERHNI